jgi:hypothetical protein
VAQIACEEHKREHRYANGGMGDHFAQNVASQDAHRAMGASN